MPGVIDVRESNKFKEKPISSPSNRHMLSMELRSNGPQISRLYDDALGQFEGIYGDGVGPAKGQTGYLSCKATFHAVADLIGQLPIHKEAGKLSALWTALKQCRELAQSWSGASEMATFGSDLHGMTAGAMLALSYAATASDMPLGPRFYQEVAGVDQRAARGGPASSP